MREIKFRAWDEKNKIMIWKLEGCSKSCGNIFSWDSGYKHIMQFTGLKDKKGKDIYEGDIFKHSTWTNDKGITQPVLYIVEWKDSGWGWKQIVPVMTMAFEISEVEVIGNIYENSELLGVK